MTLRMEENKKNDVLILSLLIRSDFHLLFSFFAQYFDSNNNSNKKRCVECLKRKQNQQRKNYRFIYI